MSLIILEIPHRLPAKAWFANSKNDFMNKVDSVASATIWHEWKKKEIVDCWDEIDEIPDGIKELLSKGCNKIVEVNEGFESEYYPANEAPEIFDVYEAYNGHDLQSQIVMTCKEAKEYNGTGMDAVQKIIEDHC